MAVTVEVTLRVRVGETDVDRVKLVEAVVVEQIDRVDVYDIVDVATGLLDILEVTETLREIEVIIDGDVVVLADLLMTLDSEGEEVVLADLLMTLDTDADDVSVRVRVDIVDKVRTGEVDIVVEWHADTLDDEEKEEVTDEEGEIVLPFVGIGDTDTDEVTLRVRVGETDVERVGVVEVDKDAQEVPETLFELERVRVGDDEVLAVLVGIVENDTEGVALLLRDGEADADGERVDRLLADSVELCVEDSVANKPVDVTDFVAIAVDFVVTVSVGFARVEYVPRGDDENEVLPLADFETLDDAESEKLSFAEFDMRDEADTDGDGIKIDAVGFGETVIDRDAAGVADSIAVAV